MSIVLFNPIFTEYKIIRNLPIKPKNLSSDLF